jgi:hypothetical protein
MCIIYTIQNMDKQSLSYAAVFNLQAETHLVGTEYSWLTRYAVTFFIRLTTMNPRLRSSAL